MQREARRRRKSDLVETTTVSSRKYLCNHLFSFHNRNYANFMIVIFAGTQLSRRRRSILFHKSSARIGIREASPTKATLRWRLRYCLPFAGSLSPRSWYWGCGEKRERQDLATQGLGTRGIKTLHSQRQWAVDNDRMHMHLPPTRN